MKRLFRILFGIPISPFVFLITTLEYVCTFDDENSWKDYVGLNTWYIASGQWNKLID